MGWYILIAVIVLFIHGAIASTFADYAAQKGYDKSPYFWACFFLGVAGYCMVAALPDLVLYSKLDEIASNTDITPISENNTWICGKCKTENSMNYSQCKKCGTYRS